MTLDSTDLANIRAAVQQALVVSYAKAVQVLAPIFYLRMDAASGTTETDLGSIGSSANGTYSATGVTLGQPGATGDGDSAALFASGSAYLYGTGLNLGTGTHTLSIWVNPVAGFGSAFIFSQILNRSGNGGMLLQIAEGGTYVQVNGIDTAYGASVVAPAGQWTNIVLIMPQDPGQASLGQVYVNGVYRGVCDGIQGNYGPTNWAVNGVTDAGSGLPGYGGNVAIDEVAVFPGALTAAQVAALYAAATPQLAPSTNVSEWGGVAVGGLPNSGPVALAPATYLAIAREILGGSLTSGAPGSQAIVGRQNTLPFFAAASTQRVVMVSLGDSEEHKDNYGVACATAKALLNSGGLWGTGIQNANAIGQTGTGIISQPASSGSADTGAPAALNAYMPYTGATPDYSYTASGTPNDAFYLNTGAFSNPVPATGAAPWPGMTGNVRLHLTYGTNPGWTGSWTPGGRYNQKNGAINTAALPALTPAASMSSGTSGAAALVDGSWDWPAGTFGEQDVIQIDFGTGSGSNGAGSGPWMGFYWQAECRDIHSGYSFQTLVYYGGEPSKQVLVALQAMTTQGIREFFREAMLYAGPDKLCCIRIGEGTNDRGDSSASWDKNSQAFDGPAGNTYQGYYNNVEGIMLFLQSAWAAQGFPASSLFFELVVSHPISLPDDAQLALYRTATDALSAAYPTACSVHLELLTSQAELSEHLFYELSDPVNGTATPEPHLTFAGYDFLCALEVAALEPTGPEIVVNAARLALAGSAATTAAAVWNAAISPTRTITGSSTPLPTSGAGVGPYALNQNGGAGAKGAAMTVNGVACTIDCLRVVDSGGNGIDGASLRLYASSDSTLSNLLGAASTGLDGRWLGPIYCSSGSYALSISTSGVQTALESIAVP